MLSYWMHTKEGQTTLETRSIDIPTPGPNQVLVELKAASLNRGEFVVGHGLHKGDQATQIGMEGAGVIAGLGEAVSGFAVGDRVMGRCKGAFAEYACMDTREAMLIPANLSFEQAASAPLAFLVVHDMLTLQGELKAHEWLLINGVSSGVGVCALQYAKAIGAKVIGTSGSPDKLARLKQHGLDVGICTRQPDFANEVLSVTNGRGVDLVVNTVGGTVFAEDVKCMAFEARFAMVGYVDNTLSAEIDLQALHAKRLRFFGVSNKLRTPEQRAEFLPAFKRDILPFLGDGSIQPLVDEVFPFADLAQAKAMMETNAHVGKIVIRMPNTGV